MAQEIFVHCREVSRDQLGKSSSFTTLPVRLHVRSDIADAACLALSRDWGAVVGDGREKVFHGAISDTGNWNAFIFPECLPERLGLISYIGEVGMLHDDACEEMSVEDARIEHEALATALDPQHNGGATGGTASKDSRNNKLKTLVSQAILESFKLGHQQAMEMLQIYRNEWLRVMEHDNTDEIETLDQYFYHRARNGGMGSYWNLFGFGMGIHLSADDEATIADLKRTAERCFLLTNDYFSWEREHEQSAAQDRGKVFNAVWFLMHKNGLSEEAARGRVKTMILELEAEYLAGKSKLLRGGNVSFSTRKWLEACAVAMGGNHYWCSTCPRQNDWCSAPRRPPADQVSVSELIGLASAGPGYPSPGSDQPIHANRGSVPASKRQRSGQLPAAKKPKTSAAKPPLAPAATTKMETSKNREGDDPLSHMAATAPITYIASLPSKGVRTLLIEAVNTWLDVPSATLSAIDAAISALHNSSLMLDDIQDGSPLRRGHPATHVVFGPAQTINSATYLYVKAVARIASLDHPQAVAIVLDDLERLFVGQSWDLYWTFHSTIPSRDDYLSMVGAKTGGLFRMLLRLMASSSCCTTTAGSDSTTRFDALAQSVGRFFQIRDDYMNLVSADYTEQKGFAEDLDEGKFSYPLIVAVGASERTRDHVLGILRSRRPGEGLAPEVKRYVLALMEETGALRETGELLERLEGEIEGEIEGLEGVFGRPNPMLRLLLKSLSVRAEGKRD